MLRRRALRSGLPCLLAVTLTACGSTVQTTTPQQALVGAPQAQGLDAGDGISGPADAGATAPGTGGASTGLSGGTTGGALPGAGGAPTLTGGGAVPGAAPGGATGGATTRSGSAGRVVPDDKPIKVGFVTPDFTKLLKAFGGSGEGASAFNGYKNMIKTINERGGIQGHKIDAYYHATDGAANDYATEAQRACVTMTQDRKVDIVITTSYFREDFNQCLRRAGVAQIDTDQFANAPARQRALPSLLTPNALNIDAAYATLVDRMRQTGWLSSDNVVGVLIEGCPQNIETYRRVVQPRVQALGSRTVDTTFDCIGGTGDIGGAQSAIKSAVLRFQSEGVDRVMTISAAEATVTVGFQQNANSQGYKPGYMVTTYALPTGWSKVYANGQAASTTGDQRNKMRGIGWSSLVDLDKRVFPANQRQAAAQEACRALDPTENGTVGKRDPIGTAFFMWGCDSLQVLSAILVDNGFRTDLDAVRASYLRVAATVPSAGNPLGTFAPSAANTDGVQAVYTFAFSTECTCFVSDGTTSRPSR